MKSIIIFFIILLVTLSLCNCKEATENKPVVTQNTIIINNFEVLKKDLVLNQIEGKWYYNNQPFNGYSIKLHSNDTLAERLGYYKGKREGIAQIWSENGVLRVESHYKQNRLTGQYRSWWENGILGSESNYVDGKMNGVEKKWYPTGQLSKERHLLEGKEKGMQKAWLENGNLYVNYEAKNGRVFGMKRASSCYKLEDEVIIRD